MNKPKKMTVRRKLIAIGCKKDFGLGVGVIAEETVDYKDNGGHGFDSSMFAMALVNGEAEMVKRYVKVVSEEVKPKARGKKR